MSIEIGQIFEGKVTGITKFGAFVELPEGKSGMVHISEVSDTFVNDISEHLNIDDTVKVKVIGINEAGKISLSIRKALPTPKPQRKFSSPRPQKVQAPVATGNPDYDIPLEKSDNAAFEDMIAKYKQTSDEKLSGLKKNGTLRKGSSRRNGR